MTMNYSWQQICTSPGSLNIAYTESGSATNTFTVTDGVVMSTGGGTMTIPSVVGLVACFPTVETATEDGTPSPTTLTSITGTFDSSTCEFTFGVTGEDSGQPAYTLTYSSGPPSMFSEGYHNYLEGDDDIVIPAVSGSVFATPPQMTASLVTSLTLTITSN